MCFSLGIASPSFGIYLNQSPEERPAVWGVLFSSFSLVFVLLWIVRVSNIQCKANMIKAFL